MVLIKEVDVADNEEELPIYNLGDILDKLTILTRKIQFGETGAISEHRYLEKALGYYNLDGKLLTNLIQLAQYNFEIWNLENEMRRDQREEHEFKLEELAEYGRRSRRIRAMNGKRIEAKNAITDIMKSGFKEVKVNHLSR